MMPKAGKGHRRAAVGAGGEDDGAGEAASRAGEECAEGEGADGEGGSCRRAVAGGVGRGWSCAAAEGEGEPCSVGVDWSGVGDEASESSSFSFSVSAFVPSAAMKVSKMAAFQLSSCAHPSCREHA
jgi:hypothetical protein